MSAVDAMPDDALDALAAGVYSPTDAEARELAAEVLRLRDRADAAHLAFVRIIQAASVCGEVDLAAVDATPVRALDAVEALVASWEHQLRAASQVPGLRARAEQAEAERDALRARAEAREERLRWAVGISVSPALAESIYALAEENGEG